MDFENRLEGFNQPESFGKSQDIESRVLFLERRVERILGELEKIREKPNVEQVIVDFLEDLEKIKKEWKKEEEKINFIKSFIEEFDRKADEIRKIDIKDFEEKVEMLNQGLKRLEEQKRMIEGVYDTIFSATKPLNERISTLENEVKSIEARAIGLKEFDLSRINELENRISSLEDDLRRLGSTFSVLPSQGISKELEERIENIDRKISSLELTITNLKPSEIKEVSVSTDEIAKNFFNLTTRIDELEKKIKLLEESFDRSLEEFKSMIQKSREAKKAELSSVIENITQKISSIEERLETKKRASPIVIE
ncbi:MAG: hypothetical protein NZ942_02820 [Candidatus Aenigmarchaeota archaeon]|nr:hypothetical protein [Candidatus Aenigmarchaeota archaeon]